jgi:ribosomal protein L39E
MGRNPYTKQELGKNLLRLGTGSAGLGMGAAGLFGLLNYLTAKDHAASSQPTLIKIDRHRAEEEEEEEKQQEEELIREDIPEDILPFPKAAEGFLNPFNAEVYKDYPAYPALALATIGGGGLAGWKSIEWLLKKMRKSKRKGELENARQDYEAALREQYGTKEGAHATYAALDAVYDECVKLAEGKGPSTINSLPEFLGEMRRQTGQLDQNKWPHVAPSTVGKPGDPNSRGTNNPEHYTNKPKRRAWRGTGLLGTSKPPSVGKPGDPNSGGTKSKDHYTNKPKRRAWRGTGLLGNASSGKQAEMRLDGGPATDIWNAFTDNPMTEDYYKWGIMTPALLAALGFGYTSYANRQERSRNKALREAKRRRALELAQRRPTRFIAELEEEEEDE